MQPLGVSDQDNIEGTQLRKRKVELLGEVNDERHWQQLAAHKQRLKAQRWS